MITVISGTNRPGSNTLKIAKISANFLESLGNKVQLCDLLTLPKNIFSPENYGSPPEDFKPYQEMILKTDGIVTVTPEYNGSFPGALKYFIDLLKFPESLKEMPCCFIGLAAGVFGAVRSIEQLELIYQYRGANLYNRRAMFSEVHYKLNKEGTKIKDDYTRKKMDSALEGFSEFVRKLKG